jgi:hypothetical protein
MVVSFMILLVPDSVITVFLLVVVLALGDMAPSMLILSLTPSERVFLPLGEAAPALTPEEILLVTVIWEVVLTDSVTSLMVAFPSVTVN